MIRNWAKRSKKLLFFLSYFCLVFHEIFRCDGWKKNEHIILRFFFDTYFFLLFLFIDLFMHREKCVCINRSHFILAMGQNKNNRPNSRIFQRNLTESVRLKRFNVYNFVVSLLFLSSYFNSSDDIRLCNKIKFETGKQIDRFYFLSFLHPWYFIVNLISKPTHISIHISVIFFSVDILSLEFLIKMKEKHWLNKLNLLFGFSIFFSIIREWHVA